MASQIQGTSAWINGQRIEVAPGETLLLAALRQGVDFPNRCRVGGCGTCRCRLAEGQVHERTETAYLLSEDEIKRQDQAGIQVIKFDPATAKQYLDKAYDSGWAGVIKNSPEYGPKLKQALTK